MTNREPKLFEQIFYWTGKGTVLGKPEDVKYKQCGHKLLSSSRDLNHLEVLSGKFQAVLEKGRYREIRGVRRKFGI
jgi:hypothetical protein